MNTRLWIKLICLAGAAFLGPLAAPSEQPLTVRLIPALIALFTTVAGYLDKGVANLEAERKETT